MKKILLSSLMLLSMALVFTACEDDRDSNPTLVQPTSFTLNNPVNNMVDLSASTGIPFAWSQPDYGGWPAAVEYQLEVSVLADPEQWTVTTDEAAADETGETIANYAILPTFYTSCSGDMSAVELAKALMSLCKWEEGSVPEKQTVYVRAKAKTAGAETVYSNVVSLDVNPYYIELADAPIEIWYLTGDCTADGSWTNSPDAIGTKMTPMYPIAGNEYDPRTGYGVIEYAAYFPAGANFKIIAPAGLSNWNYGMCGGDENGGQVYRDGGDDPGNITITEAGYYKILLNTGTHEMTWEKLDGVKVFTQIAMPGNYQGWNTGENLMNAMNTVTENHDWYLMKVTFEETTLKFAADNSWDVNWGSVYFPYGVGAQNGDDIPVKAGTYNVFFNDILGTYNFVAVE